MEKAPVVYMRGREWTCGGCGQAKTAHRAYRVGEALLCATCERSAVTLVTPKAPVAKQVAAANGIPATELPVVALTPQEFFEGTPDTPVPVKAPRARKAAPKPKAKAPAPARAQGGHPAAKAERNARIKALYQETGNYTEVARQVGLSPMRVWTICNRT